MKAIVSFIAILLVACASAPPTPSSKTIEPATGAPDAVDQEAADRRFAEEARSYKLVERDGQKFYCRSERSTGSHVKAMSCVSENQLRARVEDAEMQRKRSKPAMCAKNDPRCSGS